MLTPIAKVVATGDVRALSSPDHDCVVVVGHSAQAVVQDVGCAQLQKLISDYQVVDQSFGKTVSVIYGAGVSGNRMVYSPIKSIGQDIDDVRRVRDAVRAGVKRAIELGARRLSLYVSADLSSLASEEADFSRYGEVALLAALEESYVTFVARDWAHSHGQGPETQERLEEIQGVFVGYTEEELSEAVKRAVAIEKGKRLCKDIGYQDSERMTPLRCAEMIKLAFRDQPSVEYEEVTDLDVIRKEYPLLWHSSRASHSVPHTRPCLVKLRYRAADRSQVKDHLFVIGKGVTFDTGGISLKVGGSMRGMSRDKLGACGVAGFMLSTAELAPPATDVTALLGFERNSIGPDALLPDEVLVSRAGVRVHINDTDAEGRLVMADPTCEAREEIDRLRAAARQSGVPAPRTAVVIVATLTGHVIRAYGHYGAVVTNGPARTHGLQRRLEAAGEAYATPLEHSPLRRDDFDFIASHTNREDVYQTNDKPSVATSRGHMFPAAFLMIASGLDKHGLDAPRECQTPFAHMDVAGMAEEAAVPGLGLPALTGDPVAALAGAFL